MDPYTEEVADLQDFKPKRAHLLLRDIYGDFPHHNNGMHRVGGIPDATTWQSRWRWIAAKFHKW